MEEAEYLLGDVLNGEAELLVKDFVRSRGAEVVQSVDSSMRTDNAAEGGGKAGGQAEDGHTVGNHTLAVFLILLQEQAGGGNRNHAAGNFTRNK